MSGLDDLIDQAATDSHEHATGMNPPWLLPPVEFWEVRLTLEHIRQAALSRTISPDAVLGAMLARVVAMSSRNLVLPAIVGRRVGSELFVGVVGRPGAGKGSALDCARDLLPAPVLDPDDPAALQFVEAPIGSGEGMVGTFFSKLATGSGSERKFVPQQCRTNVLMRIDEADQLKSLGNRSEQTTMSTLRQIWSSEQLGASYSDETKNRQLAPFSYRVGLVMGVQPERAGFLLSDDGAGTPQRFSYVSAEYPPMPDDSPPWPGALDWIEPAGLSVETLTDMVIAPAIVAEIRRDHLEVVRGGSTSRDDAHRSLRCLKLAAAFAFLDNRIDINDEDWALAKIVNTTSDAVRNRVRDTIQLRQRERVEAQARMKGQEHLARLQTEDEYNEQRVEDCANRILSALTMHGPQTARQLHDMFGARDKLHRLPARKLLIERSQVELVDGMYRLVHSS